MSLVTSYASTVYSDLQQLDTERAKLILASLPLASVRLLKPERTLQIRLEKAQQILALWIQITETRALLSTHSTSALDQATAMTKLFQTPAKIRKKVEALVYRQMSAQEGEQAFYDIRSKNEDRVRSLDAAIQFLEKHWVNQVQQELLTSPPIQELGIPLCPAWDVLRANYPHKKPAHIISEFITIFKAAPDYVKRRIANFPLLLPHVEALPATRHQSYPLVLLALCLFISDLLPYLTKESLERQGEGGGTVLHLLIEEAQASESPEIHIMQNMEKIAVHHPALLSIPDNQGNLPLKMLQNMQETWIKNGRSVANKSFKHLWDAQIRTIDTIIAILKNLLIKHGKSDNASP